MTITRSVALATIATMLLGVVPAAQGGQAGRDPDAPTQDDRGADLKARRAEVQRRREALQQRQDELRRARQAARRGPMASEPSTAVARIGRQGALNLVNPSGNVTITAGGGDEVRIESVKRVWEPTEAEASAALSQVTVDVIERPGTVDVRASFERPRRLDAEVDFTIAVPPGTSVSVRALAGDVTVTGVRGELRVEAVGGAITATSVGQVRTLRTLAGAVQLENAGGDDLTVSTLSGPVTIRQLKTRAAELRSVGGDLVVTDSEAERVTAQSLNGRVELGGQLAKTGRYLLQSQTGDVRLIPGSADFELEATAVNGTVRSDYPLTVSERRDPGVMARPSARAGRAARNGRGGAGLRVLRGLSGGGGPLVTLRSFSGDITVARR